MFRFKEDPSQQQGMTLTALGGKKRKHSDRPIAADVECLNRTDANGEYAPDCLQSWTTAHEEAAEPYRKVEKQQLKYMKLNQTTGDRTKVREFESERISDSRARLRISFI